MLEKKLLSFKIWLNVNSMGKNSTFGSNNFWTRHVIWMKFETIVVIIGPYNSVKLHQNSNVGSKVIKVPSLTRDPMLSLWGRKSTLGCYIFWIPRGIWMKFERMLVLISCYYCAKFDPNPRRDSKVIRGQIFSLRSMGVEVRLLITFELTVGFEWNMKQL